VKLLTEAIRLDDDPVKPAVVAALPDRVPAMMVPVSAMEPVVVTRLVVPEPPSVTRPGMSMLAACSATAAADTEPVTVSGAGLAMETLLPPLSLAFYPAKRAWYRSFERLVAAARRNPDPAAPDLLNAAMTAGTPLPDAALAETLATNFFGGVFSCSSTVNTALYLLARHPEERAKVVRAVREELAPDHDLAALDGCRPLEFAIREAMRYYPAVPLYFRNSAPGREVQVGRHTLPPDTPVFISNWYLHKFSPHWRDPGRFDPDRWDGEVAEANPYGSGHFFPFGRGPRACIGAGFGQFVHRLVLSVLYRESEPDIDTSHRYRQTFFFGVMMPAGLTARFRPRA